MRLALVLLAAALAGCGSLKPYADGADRNLNIRTQVSSGSAFSSVRASVDVYRADAGCIGEYEGTRELDAAAVAMGLPADRPSYLVFRFNSSAFLGSSTGSISYDTLFVPRRGAVYDADVRYVDNIYNVAIRDAAGRELQRRGLRACRG